MRQDAPVCPHCNTDPFSYAQTEYGPFLLAITCCEKGISDAYQELASDRPIGNNVKLLPPETF